MNARVADAAPGSLSRCGVLGAGLGTRRLDDREGIRPRALANRAAGVIRTVDIGPGRLHRLPGRSRQPILGHDVVARGRLQM